MQLKLSKVQLLRQLHDLLGYSRTKPILITSKPYIAFMEHVYGSKFPPKKTEL